MIKTSTRIWTCFSKPCLSSSSFIHSLAGPKGRQRKQKKTCLFNRGRKRQKNLKTPTRCFSNPALITLACSIRGWITEESHPLNPQTPRRFSSRLQHCAANGTHSTPARARDAPSLTMSGFQKRWGGCKRCVWYPRVPHFDTHNARGRGIGKGSLGRVYSDLRWTWGPRSHGIERGYQ